MTGDSVMSLEHQAPRTHCIRCGMCCLKGGPTLHEADEALFAAGKLRRRDVYTLRKGEVVRNIDDTLMVLDEEMIKIKGSGENWSCIFYDQELGACRIYDDRPLECRAMKCWDLADLKKAMAEPRLRRRDFMGPDGGLVKIIDAHERKCAYSALESAVKLLEGPDAEDAVNKVIDFLRYDRTIRRFLTNRAGIDPEDLDFLFGRPLSATIRMFGLGVKKDGDTYILSPINQDRSISG